MKKIESTPYYRYQRCAPFAVRIQGRMRFVQQPKPHRLQLVWTREARPVRDRRRHRSQPRRTYQSLYRTSFYPPLQQRRSRPHRAQAPRSRAFHSRRLRKPEHSAYRRYAGGYTQPRNQHNDNLPNSEPARSTLWHGGSKLHHRKLRPTAPVSRAR